MSSSERFGMMEGAYFVGRIELLNWLNGFFGFSYTKVEQCCSAAAYCQILDAIHPGKVALHKVRFNARLEYEWIANFKVLQNAFARVGLKKYIDIQKLTRGKYQDNLEFLQWFKRYFDLEYDTTSEYDAVARRAAAAAKVKGRGSGSANFSISRPSQARKRNSNDAPTVPASARQPRAVSRTANRARQPRASLMPTSSTGVAKKQPLQQSNARSMENMHALRAETKKQAKEIATLTARVKEVELKERDKEAEMSHLRVIAQGLEQERDYYFKKLQELEMIFQEKDDSDPLVAEVLKVLYDEEPAAEPVADE